MSLFDWGKSVFGKGMISAFKKPVSENDLIRKKGQLQPNKGGISINLFNREKCDFCRGTIGASEQPVSENYHICKKCKKKLSPWFRAYSRSTAEQIRMQLDMRADNKQAADAFNITKKYGKGHYRIYFDEPARKFIVWGMVSDNPDIFNFSQVIDVETFNSVYRDEVFIDEHEARIRHNPPLYEFRFDFFINIRLKHPYVDHINFSLNPEPILIGIYSEKDRPDPSLYKIHDYYNQMANEIINILKPQR